MTLAHYVRTVTNAKAFYGSHVSVAHMTPAKNDKNI